MHSSNLSSAAVRLQCIVRRAPASASNYYVLFPRPRRNRPTPISSLSFALRPVIKERFSFDQSSSPYNMVDRWLLAAPFFLGA
jgi:hypothetical protein